MSTDQIMELKFTKSKDKDDKTIYIASTPKNIYVIRKFGLVANGVRYKWALHTYLMDDDGKRQYSTANYADIQRELVAIARNHASWFTSPTQAKPAPKAVPKAVPAKPATIQFTRTETARGNNYIAETPTHKYMVHPFNETVRGIEYRWILQTYIILTHDNGRLVLSTEGFAQVADELMEHAANHAKKMGHFS